MGQIIFLDQNMVNMIAAGEVIERPASVVKELMENSIDAGATKITVSVEDGGRKLISVADDGCGMDAEDLARAFEPHATSKIKTTADLHRISTFGFRGEALASIASVAQVKAVSRPPDSALVSAERRAVAGQANCIQIDCGSKSSVSPCSADSGTTIYVRDLFYKLPARRKFLKTANTEMSHIIEHFTRVALGFYSIKDPALHESQQEATSRTLDLTLIHNGRELYRLSGDKGLRHGIAELFPMLPAVAEPAMAGVERPAGACDDFIEAESNERGLHIFALLGTPSVSRTSNKFQYIFLNGRFIRDKFISHAIKEAYRGLLEPDRFPVVFLFIGMSYEDYDVNVHPTKVEVRFYNANLVYSQVLACLREKLLSTNLETRAKLPARESSPASGHGDQGITDAIAEFLKRHRPVLGRQASQTPQKHFPAVQAGGRQIARSDISTPAPNIAAEQRNFIQIHDSFIVAQTDDGFVIIDQHALHERIIYEYLRRRMSAGSLESQKLLIPESFEVSEGQLDVIENNAELLEKLGIELVPFGPRTMAIQAFPSLLANAVPLDFVRDLIDLLDRRVKGTDAEGLLEEVLNMAACKAAVKAGQKLSDCEIEQLLADKELAESASRCPHGRPTTIKFSISDLEKQFKRI